MAQPNTKCGANKRRSSQDETRFYPVKAVQAIRTRLTGNVNAYQRKYAAQPLKTGKGFMADLKGAPRKTIVNLTDSGKARMSELGKDTRSRIDTFAEDGRAFFAKAGKDPRKTVNDLLVTGKERAEDLHSNTRNKVEDLLFDLRIFRQGVQKDTRMVLAEAIDASHRALNQVPATQNIEKEIASRLKALPAAFNLPSREEIDDLVLRVKQLNAKVDALNKIKAA